MEKANFLKEQLITYLGNKRALLPHIENIIVDIKKDMGNDKVSFFDGFAGSGIVSRLAKKHSHTIISNDMETYSTVASLCYLTNEDDVDEERVRQLINSLNSRAKNLEFDAEGTFQTLYAPRDTNNIQEGERAFYTQENARKLDFYTTEIHKLPEDVKNLLLGPLLSAASKHANTSGVFKGFYKSKKTGIGKFGGEGENALKRILGEIELSYPILSNYKTRNLIIQKDVNEAVHDVGMVDIAYYDPPYNQHPYGSNYFMLNIISKNERPQEISKVSGIPKNWNRSQYNKRQHAKESLANLINNTKSRYIVISFNNEGFISLQEFEEILSEFGELTTFNINYSAFKGSRNLQNREKNVTEFLFVIRKTK